MSEPGRTPAPDGPARHHRLEQRYRRLLAWYPEPFRSEHEEEMLAVLLASASPGQQQPGLADSADVIRSALGMRVRNLLGDAGRQDRADARAVFSLVGPLYLISVSVLELALPYRFSLPSGNSERALRVFVERAYGGHPQIGGLQLLTRYPADYGVALGSQLMIAVLVLAGWRRPALAATAVAAGYWIISRYVIPQPLQVLSTSVYILEAAALIASPGPRRGRQLVTWRHGIVLLLAAAAVEASTFAFFRTVPIIASAGTYAASAAAARPFVIAAAALGAAAALAAALVRMNWYLGLLLAVVVYPWAIQLVFHLSGPSGGLLGLVTPGHLAVAYLPPLVIVGGAVLTSLTRLGGSKASQPSGPDQPRPA